MTDVKLSIPLKFRRGSQRENQRASVDSALAQLDYLDAIRPIAGSTILDYGCGVKLTQSLYERDSPQRLYVGLDVYRQMIEYMQERLQSDPKYSYATVNFQNSMYNPDGIRMTADSMLPIDDQHFDIITLFSVITHMQPEDVRAILQILRHYASNDTLLLFSTFIDDSQSEDFVDENSERPLLRARYRRSFIEGITHDAGWRIEALRRPISGVIQHHLLCYPA